ncbi:Protein N-acetyltransferase, RimJ/RimL family [Bacillus sp. OV322]|uniref:GNAT family N-acetyltransferase n=1 Tax=Bacillus sp. OV322 TaxID=1882764 RepID=UPI0008F27221|nr:GNAT family protein [Bacillus sp. OV322]SFC40462.1 Protein N-acetyltransferase, RimJ/RimL family [Bacillus sp. OV322]
MNEAPMIKGDKVLLRQPIERDVIDYLKIEVNKELERMYGGDTRNLSPKTKEDAQKFVNAIKINKLEWCVEFEGRFVGQARLTVNKLDNRARYAVGLFDPTVWNKGLGTKITQLVLRYAFEELQLHRVDLRVLQYNKRAIKCYEKCGFIQEGVEREGALIEGKYETDIFMSILDREYQSIKDSFIEIGLLS